MMISTTRTRLAILAGALACAALPALAQRGTGDELTGRVTIEGQVFDAQGKPLAGVHVAVLEKGSGSPLDLLRRDLETREVVTRPTDREGLFRVDVLLPGRSGRLLVRCYDAERWDHVRYEPPADVDVTNDVRRRGRAVVTCRVSDAPVWQELAHRIEKVGGPGTARGKILRTHGMPTEIVRRAGGTLEWHYASVTYVFERGELIRTEERAPGDAAGRAAR